MGVTEDRSCVCDASYSASSSVDDDTGCNCNPAPEDTARRVGRRPRGGRCGRGALPKGLMVVGVVLLLLTLLMLENIGGADAAAAKKKRGAGKGGGKARVAKRRGRRKVPKKVGADGSGTKLTEAEAKKFIKESKQAKAFNAKAGMWDQLMPQLTCTACERALFTIQNELSKLILRDATLDESKAFVDERVHDICGDPVTFPPTNEPYRNACHLFMQGHEQQIIDTLYDRLDPDSENYQEDIPTWIFCREIEACAEGQVSLDQQLREADL